MPRSSSEPPPTPQSRTSLGPASAIRAALERQMQPLPLQDRRYAIPNIPDHELLHRVGIGAYGEVWLARNALGTLRAVKIVYRVRFEDDRPYQREVNGILKYEPVSRSHPGLIQVLHVGRNDEAGCFYSVMELADPAPPQPATSIADDAAAIYSPRTLRSELTRRQRLPPTEAAKIAVNLAEGLSHLHDHGLVHRDVKPANVIFVNGQPKLADIGLEIGRASCRERV